MKSVKRLLAGVDETSSDGFISVIFPADEPEFR